MSIFKSLVGTYRISIIGASTTETLSKLNAAGISLWDVEVVDPLTVHLTIYRHQFSVVEKKTNAFGDCVKIINKQGSYWTIASLRKRPILVIGMALLLCIAFYLPTRVLFVRVEGNVNLSEREIIEKAENCGIQFGASRRQVRSEKVKNRLLDNLPQLQWAGVNTYGCVAVISVKERNSANATDGVQGVASLVARADGIVTEMTVIRGNPICAVGQAVKSGQVLVSGYTDCGLSLKAEVAQGEIFADTRREMTVVSPAQFTKREEIIKKERKYSLLLGKKLIKFYKDSGISDTSCVKMYKENYITLPGGFIVPIAIVTEEFQYYSSNSEALDNEADFLWLNDYADSYLKKQMVSGSIQQRNYTGRLKNDNFFLNANYACNEMIGQLRSEEILLGDGKND